MRSTVRRVPAFTLLFALLASLLGVVSAAPAAAAAPFTVSSPSISEGNSGTKTLTFTITYTGSGTATASYTTRDGSATAGEDYETEAGPLLTFSTVMDEQTVDVTINGDTVGEPDEIFYLDVTDTTVAVGSGETATGTGTIFNDEDVSTIPQLSVANATGPEGTPPGSTEPGFTNLEFTVSATPTSTLPITFSYSTADNTARAYADYTPASGTGTIAPNTSSTKVTVPVRTEVLNEVSETLTLTISNARNALIDDNAGMGTVANDDDGDVVLSPSYTDGWVLYGEECDGDFLPIERGRTFVTGPGTPPSGAGSLRFETLSDPIETHFLRTRNYDFYRLDELTELAYSTYVETDGKQPPYFRLSVDTDGDRTADQALFYFPVYNGTVVNDQWQTWNVLTGDFKVNGDSGPEITLAQFIAANPNATIAPTAFGGGTAILQGCGGASTTNAVTYTDLIKVGTKSGASGVTTAYDLEPDAVISFSSPTYSAAENGGSATITLTRSGRGGGTVAVPFTTTNGTATAPGDYIDSDQTVTFADTETSKTVPVPIVDDSLAEGSETVNLAVTDPEGPATLGANPTAVLTITDVEPGTVSFSANSYSVAEDGLKVTITVNRSAGSTTAATVTYATSNGSATAGADYTAASGTLSFAAGETTKTFDVTIADDAIVEGSETFNVTLSSPSGTSTTPPATAVVTITDVEAGSVQLSASTYNVSEDGTKVTITVNRSAGATTATSVNYSTGGGTATAGADYVDNDSVLTFAAGELTKTVDVLISDDAVAEGNETFNFTLSSPTGGATLGSPSTAVVTIADVEGGTVRLSSTSYSVVEGAEASITVERTAGSTTAATVTYSTGTGTAGTADFTTSSGTVSFAAGETSKTFTVPTTQDSLDEPAERFTVMLGTATGAVRGAPASAIVTISDDDEPAAEPAPAPAPNPGPTEPGQGYSLVGEDGSLYAFGTAKNVGDMRGTKLNAPIIGVAYTPGGNGYWLVAKDGGIFTFGNAEFYGSTGDKTLAAPVIGMAATPSGNGYWLFASDGGIFTFGDAKFFGSMGGQKLNQPVINMEPLESGNGYWLVAADGGIFSFGQAEFFGSMGDQKLNQPVFDMTSTDTDKGYWLVARDGGVFSFGDAEAKFYGNPVNDTNPRPTRIIGMDSTPGSFGYWIADASGKVWNYGNAQPLGDRFGANNPAPMIGFSAVPGLKL